MKPIKLEITGLQSFCEKQIVDFNELTSLGLFGIFGETGSGKSTILDAMIFAIFDEIPRTMGKQGKGIRPCLNSNSDILEVVFKFELGRDIFEIKRSYRKRFSKTGEEKFEQQNPILKLNDNIIADKVTDVKNIINEYFGMSVDDFTRSVVLPQGKFSDFLKLSGQDKMKMLENIFDLEKYGSKLQEKIKTANKSLKSEMDMINIQIGSKGDTSEEYIKSLEESLEYKKNELRDNTLKKEQLVSQKTEQDLIKNIFEKIQNYSNEKENLLKNIEKIENEERLLKNHNNAVVFQESIKKINSLEEENKSLNNKILNIKETTSNLEKTLEIIIKQENDTKTDFDEILYEFNKYPLDFNELDDIRKAFQLSTDIKYLSEENNKFLSILNNLSLEKKEHQDEIKEKNIILEKTLSEKENLKVIDKKEIEDVQKNIFEMKTTIESVSTLINKKNILEKEIENLTLSQKETSLKLNNAIKEIENIKRQKTKNISQELAKNLKDGDPCPVCGSIHHPNLAIEKSEAVDNRYLEELESQEKVLNIQLNEYLTALKYKKEDLQSIEIKFELNELNLQYKNLQDKLTELQSDFDYFSNKKIELDNEIFSLTHRIDSLLENIQLKDKDINSYKENIDKNSIKINNLEKEINSFGLTLPENTYNGIKNRKEVLESIEVNRRELNSKKEKIEKKLQEIYKEKENTSNKLQLESIELIKLETSLEKNKIFLNNEVESLKIKSLEKGFTSVEEIELAILPENVSSSYEVNIKYFYDTLEKLKTLIEENKKELGDRSFDFKIWLELNEELDNILKSEKVLNEELAVIKTNLENTLKAFEDNKELRKKLTKLEKSLDNLLILQKKIEGKKLVKFLARKKLNYIVYQASKRLRKITRGRYSLTIDDNCDFNIVDSFNSGCIRECSTLSGGETFIVSLTLALALSSQLQLKGNIQLEFFFLDEGFGTLDNSLLDRVIEILEEIKWKEKIKIGIISHVEDLKIRIPRRLEVSPAIPGEKGSTIKLI